MRGQRATGKIQRNNYHHGSYGPFLTGKTSSVSLIFTFSILAVTKKFLQCTNADFGDILFEVAMVFS